MSQNILELTESWEGYTPASGGRRPADWDSQLAEGLSLIENHDNLAPHVWEYRIKEAMTTDTFPLLFADTLERKMLDAFSIVGTPLAPLFLQETLKDFRAAKLFRHEGLVRRLHIVGEKGEYQARETSEEKTELSLSKYGSQVDFSWESFLNDDLGSFARFPQDLADSAINTEAWLQTSTLFGVTGPIAAVFTGAGGLAALAVLPLSIANLATALEAKTTYTSTGEPIMSSARYLVVNPSLRILAQDILTSTFKQWTDGGTAAITAHETANTVAQAGLQLIVDPWIPIVATTGTTGATSWALVSDPTNIPLAAFAHRTGAEGPELFMKASDQVRVGGGAVSQFEGDFGTDNIFYKVRHAIGAVALEHRGGWASWGQADPT